MVGGDELVCGAALSTRTSTADALDEVVSQFTGQVEGRVDLVFAFFTIDHDAERIAKRLGERFGEAVRLGCCGESIVGGGREIEEGSALVLWGARLPEARLVPFSLRYDPSVDSGSFLGWPDTLSESWPAKSIVLMLGEPFSFPADRFVSVLDEEQPGTIVVGGMASGARQQGEHRLILGDEVVDGGAVGVRLDGSFHAKAFVSQGCRPVGQPMVITKADRNVIFELGGKSALAQLQQIFEAVPVDEQWKMQQGIHLGRVINEYQDSFRRGDFLVRNVIGVDEKVGALAVGDWVRAGQTVQFHVRDAQSADEDLKTLVRVAESTSAAGALLFTCNGRGSRMFESSDHDAAIVREAIGRDAVAGFFAAGEIGPVGGKNFLHGFSASVLIFERGEPDGSKVDRDESG